MILSSGVGNSLIENDKNEERDEHMKRLIIVGASGFGRELLQWCKDVQKVKKEWEIAGFIDDNLTALDGYECEYKILGTIDEWQPTQDQLFALAIAEPKTKKKVVSKLEAKGAVFTSIIHPDARVGDYSKLGKGLVLYPNARITVNVTIGDYVTVLDNTSIGHDAVIGEYTTFSASCGINGHVQVGKYTYFGCNASTIPSIKIGEECHIGVGSVVVNNIKSGMHVFGNPAKRIALPRTEKKENE